MIILSRYHANGNTSDALVLKEMQEIDLAMEQATEGVTWKALVTNPQNRMRVFIVMTMTLMTLWW